MVNLQRGRLLDVAIEGKVMMAEKYNYIVANINNLYVI